MKTILNHHFKEGMVQKMKKGQRRNFQDTKRFDGEEQYNCRLLNKAVKSKTYARKRKFPRKEIK